MKSHMMYFCMAVVLAMGVPAIAQAGKCYPHACYGTVDSLHAQENGSIGITLSLPQSELSELDCGSSGFFPAFHIVPDDDKEAQQERMFNLLLSAHENGRTVWLSVQEGSPNCRVYVVQYYNW